MSKYILRTGVSDLNVVPDIIGAASFQKDEEQILSDSSTQQYAVEGNNVVDIQETTDKDTIGSQAVIRQNNQTSKQSYTTVVSDSVKVQSQSTTYRRGLSIDTGVPSATVSRYAFDAQAVQVDTVDLTSVNTDTLTVSVSPNPYESNKRGIEMPEMLHRSNGIFALLLFCFLIVAHVYNGGFSFIRENIMLAFSGEKADKLDSQYTTGEIIYFYFLVFLAILLVSISLYEGLERFSAFSGEREKLPFIRIGVFVIFISIFVILKLLLNRLIGYVFGLGSKVVAWNRAYLVLFSLFGLLCFLPTLILVYSNWWHGIIIGFSLFLFLVVHIILIFRVFCYFVSQRYSILSLITYILTVEILPYIYLALGLFYFYQIDIFNTI